MFEQILKFTMMKKSIFTILLAILLMTSCAMEQSKKPLEESSSNLNEITDFEQYLSLFEDVELPIVLDESFCGYEIMRKKDSIKADFVELFIGKKIINLLPEESLFDYYTFYPMVKFHVSSSIIGVIHAESGIAGGAEDHCILSLYTTSGEKTDELVVWEFTSEGEYFSETMSIITSNKISLVETGNELDEDSDSDEEVYRETYRRESEYRIDTVHGRIEILKE
jgi:hypothetical protein